MIDLGVVVPWTPAGWDISAHSRRGYSLSPPPASHPRCGDCGGQGLRGRGRQRAANFFIHIILFLFQAFLGSCLPPAGVQPPPPLVMSVQLAALGPCPLSPNLTFLSLALPFTCSPTAEIRPIIANSKKVGKCTYTLPFSDGKTETEHLGVALLRSRSSLVTALKTIFIFL